MAQSRYKCLNMILKKEMIKVENRLKTLGSDVSEFGNTEKNSNLQKKGNVLGASGTLGKVKALGFLKKYLIFF